MVTHKPLTTVILIQHLPESRGRCLLIQGEKLPGKTEEKSFLEDSFPFLKRDELFNVLTQEIFRHHPATHVFLAPVKLPKKATFTLGGTLEKSTLCFKKVNSCTEPLRSKKVFQVQKSRGKRTFLYHFQTLQYSLI